MEKFNEVSQRINDTLSDLAPSVVLGCTSSEPSEIWVAVTNGNGWVVRPEAITYDDAHSMLKLHPSASFICNDSSCEPAQFWETATAIHNDYLQADEAEAVDAICDAVRDGMLQQAFELLCDLAREHDYKLSLK